jgi:hypothetical protein
MNISNIKPINKKSLVCSFDLDMPSGITIFGMLYHRMDDGRRWPAFPGMPYTAKDGEKKYSLVVQIKDRAKSDKFQAAVLAALDEAGA